MFERRREKGTEFRASKARMVAVSLAFRAVVIICLPIDHPIRLKYGGLTICGTSVIKKKNVNIILNIVKHVSFPAIYFYLEIRNFPIKLLTYKNKRFCTRWWRFRI